MSLQRPRRIFRSRTPRNLAIGISGIKVVGLTAVLMGGIAVLAVASTGYLDGVPRPDFRVSAAAGQTTVIDGETLRLRDRVVRLLGVVAPSRGTTCRGSDGSNSDCGAAATRALADLVSAGPVDCRLDGADNSGRPLAVCAVSGMDLGQALVSAGWARADQDGPKDAETAARASHRGLWKWDPGSTW